ncbi:fasciclin domain-containing protein [Mucilaginibacter sp. UR6-1]|uniref:fasciclin domain-containing protein n=1 Tax=Mucilaginibacter sp. UR6-1 TaxID=1435643 RepID=UPI001E291262|nr:fasciclin domain-containing protein [Mucilaginibacter sp. UR6-1]MCC8409464.1 fasciclin domain-containing protein [Mucilaginibacter sp. UR6-1]
MKLKKYIITPLLFSVLLLLASCIKDYDTQPEPTVAQRPLLTLLENNYSFSIFYQVIKRLGMDKMLNGTEAYTLLVPDDDAFALAGITPKTVSSVDTASLRKIIGYHIIKGALPYNKIPQTVDYRFTALTAQPVYFSVTLPDPNRTRPQLLHVNGITAKKTDVVASNGVIHVLEKVLTAPAASVKSILNNNPDYSLFVQALKQFGLFDQLDKAGLFVVLAPDNEVFMQNGIDESTLATLDTLTYKKFLFAPYVIPGKFFFRSDLDDAPLTGIGPKGVRGSDYLLQIDYYNFSFQLLPDKVDPFYFPNTVQFTSSDQLAFNGVVHGINNLLITPDYALKQ